METISTDGTVTTSVERIFPIDESHSWNSKFGCKLATDNQDSKRNASGRKRGRMKQLMDDYVEELASKGRLSEDKIYAPLFKEEDYN